MLIAIGILAWFLLLGWVMFDDLARLADEQILDELWADDDEHEALAA